MDDPLVLPSATEQFRTVIGLQSHRSHDGRFVYFREQYDDGGRASASASRRCRWPDNTSIYCRQCVHPFEGQPIPLPNCKNALTGEYGVSMIFCSFACAAGWLRDNPSHRLAGERSLLVEMSQDVFGFNDPIYESPPQGDLKIFGGKLDVVEFRDVSANSELRSFIRDPPFVHNSVLLEEHKIVPYGSPSRPETDLVTASGDVPQGGLYMQYVQTNFGISEVGEIQDKCPSSSSAPQSKEDDDDVDMTNGGEHPSVSIKSSNDTTNTPSVQREEQSLRADSKPQTNPKDLPPSKPKDLRDFVLQMTNNNGSTSDKRQIKQRK